MSGIGGDVCEAHACRREVATAAWIACADMYVHWALRAFSMLTAHSVRLYSIWMCVCVCVVSCHVTCRGVEAEIFFKLSMRFKLHLWIEEDRC